MQSVEGTPSSHNSGNTVLSEAALLNRLTKDDRHDHYWTEDGILYESYQTIRGLRYRYVMEVSGMPDMNFVDDKCLLYIAKEYSS